MSSINLCTLQVRIGKCHLNLKSQASLSISLEMGKDTSSYSPIKHLQNNTLSFNTTLRMNVQKQLLEQQKSKCRVLLHLIRQNRQKSVIGIATIQINQQTNQGWKFHQFAQCADPQAQIELSVTYSNAFQLGVRSQIGYFYANNHSKNQVNQLEQSRGRQSNYEDSILDKSQYNLLKQSKAISHIEFNRNINTHPIRVKRKSDVKDLRKPKPANLSQCAPQEIITHYETQIKNFQDQIQERQDWANGMKELIQQLEAQNQLLKQIKIEELAQYQVSNLQEGIQLVSKLVHSKFQASKSMIYESPVSSKIHNKTNKSSRSNQQDVIQERQTNTQRQNILGEQQPEKQRTLTQTRSFKGLNTLNIDQSQFNNDKLIQVVQSRQQLEQCSDQSIRNALQTLTGLSPSQQPFLKISQLEQDLFKLQQQKQQLYDISLQLQAQLKIIKVQKDSYKSQINQLQHQLQRMSQYIDQIKMQNMRLKDQNQKHEKSSTIEEVAKLSQENYVMHDKTRQLQRQLKEALKAIEQFKNDALDAREELIVKDQQINTYRQRLGQVAGQSKETGNSGQVKTIQQRKIKQPVSTVVQKHKAIALTSNNNQINKLTFNINPNIHSLYTQLLQTSICQRKQLQHSLSQIISSKQVSSLATSSLSFPIQQKLRKLQTQINKMFIELLKNKPQIKNLNQVQKSKGQITRQVNELLAGSVELCN